MAWYSFVTPYSQYVEHQRPGGKYYHGKSTVFVFRSGFFFTCRFSDRTIFLQALSSFRMLKLCYRGNSTFRWILLNLTHSGNSVALVALVAFWFVCLFSRVVDWIEGKQASFRPTWKVLSATEHLPTQDSTKGKCQAASVQKDPERWKQKEGE